MRSQPNGQPRSSGDGSVVGWANRSRQQKVACLGIQPHTMGADCIADQVWIPGPVGRLQGVTNCPVAGQRIRAVAVVCHPHPLYGGTLNNKVVDYLARSFNELGVIAVRFNFRGVEASAGHYAQGKGEADDLRAVLAWVQTQYPACPLWLAGFSFGAYIALQVAHEYPLARLVTVAPPVNFFDFSQLQHPACDWLLVQGGADEVVPSEQVLDWAAAQRPAPAVMAMPGVGHFFHGQLRALRTGLLRYLGDSEAEDP